MLLITLKINEVLVFLYKLSFGGVWYLIFVTHIYFIGCGTKSEVPVTVSNLLLLAEALIREIPCGVFLLQYVGVESSTRWIFLGRRGWPSLWGDVIILLELELLNLAEHWKMAIWSSWLSWLLFLYRFASWLLLPFQVVQNGISPLGSFHLILEFFVNDIVFKGGFFDGLVLAVNFMARWDSPLLAKLNVNRAIWETAGLRWQGPFRRVLFETLDCCVDV